MKDDLINLRERALKALSEADSIDKLNDLRIKILGKKGELTQILKGMGKLSDKERPEIGKLANEIKTELEQKIAEKELELKKTLKEENAPGIYRCYNSY